MGNIASILSARQGVSMGELFFRGAKGSLRMLSAALLGVCTAAFLLSCLPGVALASSSSVETLSAESVSITPSESKEESNGAVSISVDATTAALEGSPFALEGFSRAQVGSNSSSEIYAGYRYYTASEAGYISVVVTDAFAVAYVSQKTAQQLGFDLASASDQAQLKRLVIALDERNAKGGVLLSSDIPWHFTTEQVLVFDGVEYRFDQEIKAGQFHTVVIGVDGTDITNLSNPAAIKLVGVDSARLVSSSSVDVVAAPTGLAGFVSFLQGIDMSPLWVTLKTTLTAIVFIFILGLAAAYFSLRIPARAQDIADSIFTIPMVLPPTVCGFLLLLAFGQNTVVGQWFIDIGFPLIFSWQATVIAAIVVAFPLMYRSARGAFENLDPNMLDAARTLGWSNPKIFFKLMLPLSWSSIAAGTVLSFARALGEFGATLFLAGNYLGVTRTVPIAIYFEWMNGNIEVALFWTVVIMVFSFVVILFINLWGRRTTKYRRGIES